MKNFLFKLLMEQAGADGAAAGGAAADNGGQNQNQRVEGDAGAGQSGQNNQSGQENGARDAGHQQSGNLLNSNDREEKQQPVGKFPDDWRTLMANEDPKLLKRLERYNSPAALAKAYRELETKLSSGEYKTAKLADDASPEEVAQWKKENGVPEKAEDYLSDLPSGIVIGDEDKERVNSFLESMLGKNVSKENVQAALEWNQQMVAQEMQARQEKNVQAQHDAEDTLRAEWGGEYRRNINLINGMLNQLPDDAKSVMMSAQTADGVSIFNNPKIAQFMVDLARAANPVATVTPGASNPKVITDEIASIEKTMRTDPDSYYKDSGMQDRLRELYDAQEKLGL